MHADTARRPPVQPSKSQCHVDPRPNCDASTRHEVSADGWWGCRDAQRPQHHAGPVVMKAPHGLLATWWRRARAGWPRGCPRGHHGSPGSTFLTGPSASNAHTPALSCPERAGPASKVRKRRAFPNKLYPSIGPASVQASSSSHYDIRKTARGVHLKPPPERRGELW